MRAPVLCRPTIRPVDNCGRSSRALSPHLRTMPAPKRASPFPADHAALTRSEFEPPANARATSASFQRSAFWAGLADRRHIQTLGWPSLQRYERQGSERRVRHFCPLTTPVIMLCGSNGHVRPLARQIVLNAQHQCRLPFVHSAGRGGSSNWVQKTVRSMPKGFRYKSSIREQTVFRGAKSRSAVKRRSPIPPHPRCTKCWNSHAQIRHRTIRPFVNYRWSQVAGAYQA